MTSGEPVPSEGGCAHWKCYTETVRGAAHIRQQKENQDAAKTYVDTGNAYLIVAVADGHGGEKYTRSKLGADFAVEAAISVCRELLMSQPLESFWVGLQPDEVKRLLCRRIVGEWNRLVSEDIATQGLPETPEQDNPSTRHRPGIQPTFVAYGSTLLAAVITSSFALLTQIGDGDIVMVDPNGEISRPLEEDDRSFANETCSLCMPDAWDEFRTNVIPFEKTDAALFLLTTDGYSNSFKAEEDFQKVARDIHRILYIEQGPEDGRNELEANLPAWLRETTENGSGDDISVGLLYRTDCTSEPRAP